MVCSDLEPILYILDEGYTSLYVNPFFWLHAFLPWQTSIYTSPTENLWVKVVL